MLTEKRVRELMKLAANAIHPDMHAGLERIQEATGAGAASPAPVSPTAGKEPKDAMRITKHPLELEPGDRVTNPHDDRQVIVTAPPVRAGDRVSVDYEFPPVLSPGGVGVMAVDIHAELEVSTTPRHDAIASLREMADFLESVGGDGATPGGRQLIAALALAHLLGQDLPSVDWHVDEPFPGLLEGQITVHRGADQQRADMEAWAKFLAAEIVVTPCEECVSHRVTATYRGAEVVVWARVYPEGEATR